MYVARDINGNRVYADEADKNTEYFCPVCNGKVIPHQGELVVWHYAHKASCIDSWHYDMSDWHKNWQSRFPKEKQEVVMTYNGKTHRADVCMDNYVIEFQHSEISYSEIIDRNEFYNKLRYKVIWVFDFAGVYEKPGGIIGYKEGTYRWQYPNRSITAIKPQNNRDVAILFDVGLLIKGFEDEYGGHSDVGMALLVDWAKDNYGQGPLSYSRFKAETLYSIDLTKTESLEYVMKTSRQRQFGNSKYIRWGD